MKVTRLLLYSRVATRVASGVPRVSRYYSSKIIDLEDQKDDAKAATAPSITDKFQRVRDKYESPHYPIVLCHGFSGFDQLDIIPRLSNPLGSLLNHTPKDVKRAVRKGYVQLDYWFGIKEALENLGSTVLTAKVSAFGTIEERSLQLHEFINEQCKALRSESKAEVYNEQNIEHTKPSATEDFENEPIKVNLVSHSMGGLDSRYLIHQLQMKNPLFKNPNYKVVSLTTIATPHRGSECADFIVDAVGTNPLLKAACPASVFELTTESLKQFNKAIPDNPQVKYFSYGASFNPKWYNVFHFTWNIMKYKISSRSKRLEADNKFKALYDNDGVVSVESSKWGTYVGTLDGVDHLDLINWTNRTRTVVDKIMFAEDPKFNAIALYLGIADNLAKEGF